uniref:Uncharacterized protein n=1 Tax=Anguilla anguilla TaxID=7936 RepID=A0A0E9PVH1_ANGAN
MFFSLKFRGCFTHPGTTQYKTRHRKDGPFR